jgi:hypothetical protein
MALNAQSAGLRSLITSRLRSVEVPELSYSVLGKRGSIFEDSPLPLSVLEEGRSVRRSFSLLLWTTGAC